ncbi:MAG: hypothetical protein CMM01_03040 [Rhodopirellula sp.]|nr:hypothetical protein [Rhodopirellula sp.]
MMRIGSRGTVAELTDSMLRCRRSGCGGERLFLRLFLRRWGKLAADTEPFNWGLDGSSVDGGLSRGCRGWKRPGLTRRGRAAALHLNYGLS